MNEIGPPLAVLAATAVAAAALAIAARWFNDPTRRLRRGLRAILGPGPLAVLVVPQRGRGLGFNFRSNRLAVVWDGGGWGLPYRFEDLERVQLLADGEIAGFARRGETGAPKPMGSIERRVALRLTFDDPANPHFVLELWRRTDRGRPAAEALDEAMSWLARVDDLLNRPPRSWWETPPAAPRPEPQAEPRVWPSLGTIKDQWREAPLRDADAAQRRTAGRG
jgi:hypothetical protein